MRRIPSQQLSLPRDAQGGKGDAWRCRFLPQKKRRAASEGGPLARGGVQQCALEKGVLLRQLSARDEGRLQRRQQAIKQFYDLRREQEVAFEEIQRHESLRLSRQREERRQQAELQQKKQEEAQRRLQKREERLKRQQLLRQQRAAAAAEFKTQDAECERLSPEERTTICLKLPSGLRATRVFPRGASLRHLHQWAGCAAEYCAEGTLEDAGLFPNCVVLLIEVETDEDSDHAS
ncbi:trichohyalin-like [Cyclospora cayetanensis]|uniref:Trichohyalin-like n=1 Tax=Cyclospora cayetanensis TaxID=88456 RepID=A0A6P6RTK9_9EIME|nr:trichohyalin-like [Cyclospora cayetanensis]